jgi:C4-dicarboxylate-specific signal transduction histidine kinase
MSTDRAGKPDRAAGLTLPSLLSEQPTCGIVLLDHDQKITALGGQAASVLGFGAHAKKMDIEKHSLPPVFQSLVREMLSSGNEIIGRRVELNLDTGGTTTLCVSVIALVSSDKSPQVALIMREPDGFKHFEENLRRLDLLASIGTLSASMAHEIKNALVAGKTFIDLLLEKQQDAEFGETVRREMQRIDSIVSRVLRFTGPARPSLAPVHLHDILDHSLRLVQPQAEDKSIQLKSEFLAMNDLVNGDDHQLQQAIVNLLLNALEATPEKGTLSLATKDLRGPPGKAKVHVIIEDTGAGIAPEHLDRLFEPFFTTKPEGTGLGLAITHHIVQEHNGTIRVESEPGKGATFHLVFPAIEPRA